MNIEILQPLLKRLRLEGLLKTFEQRLSQARDSSLSHQEFITLLLQDEVQRREAENFIKRLSSAKFEETKTLEELQLNRYPVKEQQIIRELMCGNYLVEHQHILIMGPTGTGKTHLAQALGHQACRQGKSVRFIRAQALHHILTASKADRSWQIELKKFLAPKLLIIDDFGLQALTATQAEDIYELIAERYLKGSFIFTSNRKVEAWMDLFPDKVMANAALDRLSNQAHHIVLTGESYRRKTSPMVKNSTQE
jgi:DNA replication protein DnaC